MKERGSEHCTIQKGNRVWPLVSSRRQRPTNYDAVNIALSEEAVNVCGNNGTTSWLIALNENSSKKLSAK